MDIVNEGSIYVPFLAHLTEGKPQLCLRGQSNPLGMAVLTRTFGEACAALLYVRQEYGSDQPIIRVLVIQQQELTSNDNWTE